MATGYVPPRAPSERQVEKANRLVVGGASQNVTLDVVHEAPAIKLRVEMKTLEAKKRETMHKMNSKCVVVKQNNGISSTLVAPVDD